MRLPVLHIPTVSDPPLKQLPQGLNNNTQILPNLTNQAQKPLSQYNYEEFSALNSL